MITPETAELVERAHRTIMSAADPRGSNLLMLACVGLDQPGLSGWAASFDAGLLDEWWEAEVIERLPYAARALTADEAIRIAAERVLAAL